LFCCIASSGPMKITVGCLMSLKPCAREEPRGGWAAAGASSTAVLIWRGCSPGRAQRPVWNLLVNTTPARQPGHRRSTSSRAGTPIATCLPAARTVDYLDLYFTNPFVKPAKLHRFHRDDWRHEQGQSRQLASSPCHAITHAMEGRYKTAQIMAKAAHLRLSNIGHLVQRPASTLIRRPIERRPS